MEVYHKPLDLLKRVIQSKWLVMVAGMYLMAAAGAAYDFSVYSQSIKLTLGLNQKDLNTISFFLGVGDGVGFIAGLLYDFWLPSGILAVGAVLNAFGYLMAWLCLTGRLFSLHHLRVWQLCLFLALGANAQSFPETAVMVICLRNSPRSRGTVLGLVKGFYGLSGAILPLIYYAVFGDNPLSFLLLAGCLPSVISLLFMFVMRFLDDPQEDGDSSIMRIFYGIATALALYLMAVLVVENLTFLSRPLVAGLTSVMLVILSLPLVVVVWSERKTKGIKNEASKQCLEQNELGNTEADNSQIRSFTPAADERPQPANSSLQIESIQSTQVVTGRQNRKNFQSLWLYSPRRGEDHTIAQALMTLDFWILFVALTCGLGSVMAFMNNMAQVGYSENYSAVKINTLVSLVSIWNFFGRIVSGFMSDKFMDGASGITRPVFFSISIAILALGNLLIAIGVKGSLYIGSVLAGLSIGAQYTLTAVIISELFGLKILGTLYTVLACAGPLGQYILSIRVAGVIYDDEARRQNRGVSKQSGGLLCEGTKCFRLTFFILTAVAAFGCFLCIVLALRTMEYYKTKAATEKHEESNLASSSFIGEN